MMLINSFSVEIENCVEIGFEYTLVTLMQKLSKENHQNAENFFCRILD